MDVKILFVALSVDEKKELHKLLSDWAIPIKDRNKTTIREFINKNKMTTRLRNTLLSIEDYYNCVEEIEPNDFIKIRNAGRDTLNEFIEVRGF